MERLLIFRAAASRGGWIGLCLLATLLAIEIALVAVVVRGPVGPLVAVLGLCALALVPLAGCGVFLGLSALTVSTLRAEGLMLPWAGGLRAALLAGAWAWSASLAFGILRRTSAPASRIALAMAAMGAAGAMAAGSWALLFWPA